MTSLRTKHNLSDTKLFALRLQIQCRVNAPGSLYNMNLFHTRWGHHPTRVPYCIWYKYDLKTWALCSEYGMPRRAHLFEFSTPRHNGAWQAEMWDFYKVEASWRLWVTRAGPRVLFPSPTSCLLPASRLPVTNCLPLIPATTPVPPWWTVCALDPLATMTLPLRLSVFSSHFVKSRRKLSSTKTLVLRSQTGIREMVWGS